MTSNIVKVKLNIRLFITVMLVLLVLVVAYFSIRIFTFHELERKEFLLHIELDIGNGTSLTIKPWIDGDTYYFFLPAYDHEQKTAVIRTDSNVFLQLGNTWVRDGMSINTFEENVEYALSVNGRAVSSIVFMSGYNIPSMYISTESGNLDYLSENKDNKETASMVLINGEGVIEYNDNLKWISGRGNSTWKYEKKAWTLKLQEDTDLLGMGGSDKWILLANILDDTAGLRNYIVYNMASDIGLEYSRQLKFINLYMNNEYYGLYLLSEKIEVSEASMPIGNLEKQNKKINEELYNTGNFVWSEEVLSNSSYRKWANIDSPEIISGGYILERNYGEKLTDKASYFITPHGDGFVIRAPEIVSEEEAKYISDLMFSVENALYSNNSIDDTTGKHLSELIDVNSWILKYLVDEVTKNEGAGATSSYFYKKQGDSLVFAGPVWDYDKSLGFVGYWKNPEGLTLCSWHDNYTEWWIKFYEKADIQELIREYYIDLIRPYILKLIECDLNEQILPLSASHHMNYIRWKDSILSNYSSFGSIAQYLPDDLPGAVAYIKDWLNQRLQFLDSVWIDYVEYCTIFLIKDDHSMVSYSVPKGTTPSTEFWTSAEKNAEFYYAEEGKYDIKYDTSRPVTEDIYLYALVS